MKDRLMTKLLQHLREMQTKAGEYIEGAEPYKGLNGNEGDGKDADPLFITDMIYMLDGPEQREAQAEAEASANFIADCLRTKSDQFNPTLVPFPLLALGLSRFAEVAGQLDVMKKLAFYGEDPAKGRTTLYKGKGGEAIHRDNMPNISKAILSIAVNSPDAVMGADDWNASVDILHAVLGILTEAGELAEMLHAVLVGKADFDPVNFMEECADIKWYMAVGYDRLGVAWGEDEVRLIDKLRARFPDKFTTHDANNRDLVAERAKLEGKSDLLFDMAAGAVEQIRKSFGPEAE